jgi:hypothetical protein
VAVQVNLRPGAAAVVASVFGLLHLGMAAVSATTFDVARSTATADFDSAWESAAGTVWLIAFIVQAVIALVIAFGWIARHGAARARLVRAGVRAAAGDLVLTLIAVAAITALGVSDDAFRGSTTFLCVLLTIGMAVGVGAAAFTASALSDKNQTR